MVGMPEEFFFLSYGNDNGWIVTLGRVPDPIFDPETGKEDFTELSQVSEYFQNWRPSKDWSPQPICLHFKARGRKRFKTDRLFHNHIGPIISERAVERMRPWLEQDGYILPLDVVNSDEKFYLWWVPLVEDSVDFARSEKYPNSDRIEKYVINSQKVNGLIAFRPHHAVMYNPYAQGRVMVTEEFRKTWISEELTGIKFKVV